jgi:GTP 3',8-cyclase
MQSNIIPIIKVNEPAQPLREGQAGLLAPEPKSSDRSENAMRDELGRAFRDLRISVTDRCNFRCTYCMPKSIFDHEHVYLPQSEILNFEEILRFTRAMAPLGLRKVRLTGGEPLLRKNIEVLIAMLREALPEIDLTLTTNGSALAQKAHALKAAGLDRVTVSLDALDDSVFKAMNDVDFPVAKVLEGVEAAAAAGLGPVKINAVIKRGVNEDQVVKMVQYFRHTSHTIRFIEFMDVGSTNGWRMDDVMTAREMLDAIRELGAIEPIEAEYKGEVAQRWRFVGESNEFGVIASVTEAFCSDCNRARLSTNGQLFTCLFAERGYEIKSLLRRGLAPDQERETIQDALLGIWQHRADRYSQIRTANTTRQPKVEMSFIGG